ncbi:MAG: glycosyltransferase [Leptolyngbyaceae cyanobacterium SM2_5_2]|nr:glycosyltransferase [Leptolyngbyaceae cyanobacterium SM2_5_2]
METAIAPFVSVIIPVYNDSVRLRLCLEALAQQTYGANHYEVIVVDNGSDIEQKTEALVAEFSPVVYAQESAPGSYAARNKGIALAKGEFLAFTDSDCIPDQNWLEKGVKHLIDNPDCGMVAGRIDVFNKNPDQPTPVELYEQVVFGFPQERILRDYQSAVTANILTRKSVIDNVGSFKANLKSGGDGEWSRRVHAAGYGQLYAEDALVNHPARSTIDEVSNRVARYAGGWYDRFIRYESSWWVRNRRLARFVVSDLVTHTVDITKKVIRDPRLGDAETRFKVLSIVFRMQCLSAYEKVRLQFGGDSRR